MTSLRKRVADCATVGAVFIILAVLVFPFAWVVLTSVRPESEIFTDQFQLVTRLTFDNFRELSDSGFLTFVRNSLIVCISATAVAVVFSLLGAYSFSRRNFRFRGGLLGLFIVSQLFPFITLVTPLYIIFVRLGLINNYLGLILVYAAIAIPFCTYLLLGYLESVPRSLDEAATMDGCSTIGVIFRVVLPVAWPGVAATATYAFILSWEEYLISLTVMTADEFKTVPVGIAGLFGEYSTDWGLVMAASGVAAVPTLLLFLLVQRRLTHGLAAGAVKQ